MKSIRTLRRIQPFSEYICTRCLSTTSSLRSGHNRWSKIKHDKGVVDMKRNQAFASFSHEISTASRLYGGDPNMNPRLAAIISLAKKAAFPKSSIETAIARGQGKSLTGASLQPLLLELKFPPSISLVIDIETDNKLRILADLRTISKSHNATVTPTSYLFTKRGRISFDADERGLGPDDVLEEAIEVGAEDVDGDEEGNIILWTEPSGTNAAAQGLASKMDLKIGTMGVVWDANEETMVEIQEKDIRPFVEFLARVREEPNVIGVYANVRKGGLSDEVWEEVESLLD